MDLRLTTSLEAAPAVVLAEMADLEAYPTWLGIVPRVVVDGDGWIVDLGARLGPVKRSKRVRMVRAAGHPAEVRFERHELDGGGHGRWDLRAEVDPPTGAGPCVLRLRIGYEGSSPLVRLLEPVLRAEMARAVPRLSRRLAAEPGRPGDDASGAGRAR